MSVEHRGKPHSRVVESVLFDAARGCAACDLVDVRSEVSRAERSAVNFFALRDEAGLPRDRLVAWNVVPWYLPSGNRTANANATGADVREAAPWLTRLMDLLPSLVLVVPMGRRAQQGWAEYAGDGELPRGLDVIATPHPSPLSLNGRPHRRDEIRDAMRRAAALN